MGCNYLSLPNMWISDIKIRQLQSGFLYLKSWFSYWNNHRAFISRQTSYHKILWSLEATRFGFRIFQSFLYLTPEQQHCWDACQILQQCTHYNIQSCGFKTSRDLAVRRHTALWVEAMGICKWYTANYERYVYIIISNITNVESLHRCLFSVCGGKWIWEYYW